ncbi:DUF2569 family protein [Parasphingopyxis sp.]|uniref:DUF2569 family protein n=1 Tax=Parasphingopyxis sp. TaxID=1920299 RepID=UPI0026069B5D|nr:DUF2569 family protein [Parasphingopyxis sp.]
MAYRDGPQGFGGWLIFLVVIYCVLTPLAELFAIIDLVAGPTSDILRPIVSNWSLFVGTYMALIALELGMLWFMGYRLAKVHSPRTVRIALVIIWINTLVMPPMGLALISIFTGSAYLPLLSGTFAEAPAELIRPAVWAVIWTLYFFNSRRVANTYREGADEEGLEEVFT